jgi:hypothetical protein
MPKLTKRTIDATEPQATEFFLWDEGIPGFGLRVMPSGRKSFVVQFRAGRRARRMSLGPSTVLTCDQARNRAITIIAAVKNGETRTDPATNESWQKVKFKPSFLTYSFGGKRYQKDLDHADLDTLQKIESMPISSDVPTRRFPIEQMYHGSRIAPKGFSNVHHFFLPRASQAMGLLWKKASSYPDLSIRRMLVYWVEQSVWGFSVLNRYRLRAYSHVNQYLTGVYYVPSQCAEPSPTYNLTGKLDRLVKAFNGYRSQSNNVVVNTGTAARIAVPDSSIDYIFTDPPFGANIYYADLNFLVESWHGVTTDARPEAIMDNFKGKALPEYQHLMQRCFTEYYRVLKPGRWMTVVFSNSKASVWNAIQVSLQQAGFVVAEVTALDKVQGSYLSRYKGAFDAFQPQVVLQAANAIERLLRLPFASWPTGASGGQMSFNLGS